MGSATVADVELFYRNVDAGDGEEIVVKASKGYGLVMEIIIEGDISETTIRLTSPAGALALGKAITQAAEAMLRS
jgi:hypothetical protein